MTGLNLISVIFVIGGTYLLSKSLFVQTITKHAIETQRKGGNYKDQKLIYRIACWSYGISPDAWFISLGTYGGDNPVDKRLRDDTAPFRGFIYIVVAGILQIICILSG